MKTAFPRLAVLLLLCGYPVGISAQETGPEANVPPATYERLEVLPAEKLIPATLRSGLGFVVENPVNTDGYFGLYLLRTEHGVFECHGKEMLTIRIDELRAIREIDSINKNDAFLKAAGNAVAKPIEATAKMVRDPKGTIEKVPHGVAALFQRAGKGLAKAGQVVVTGAENLQRRLDGEEIVPSPPINWRDWAPGFSANRNKWAAQLRVDPYTSNPVLKERLDQITAVTFSTDFFTSVGIGMVAAPLGMVGSVDKYVLTEQPEQIRERAIKILGGLGFQPEIVRTFLDQPAFTPTLQIRFARALESLAGATNLESALGLVAAVESETQARFLCACLEALAAKRSAPDAYKSLVAIAPLPAAIRADDSLLVAAPLDVLPWTPATEAFVKRAEVYPKRVILLPSQTTTSARLHLASMGWTFE